MRQAHLLQPLNNFGYVKSNPLRGDFRTFLKVAQGLAKTSGNVRKSPRVEDSRCQFLGTREDVSPSWASVRSGYPVQVEYSQMLVRCQVATGTLDLRVIFERLEGAE